MKMTVEQAKRMRNALKDPIIFTEKTGTVKGMPFRFAHREHLHDVYRDKHPRIVIVAGRQVEKSETVLRKLIYHGWTRPHTTITYTAPRNEQTTRFVNDRFRKGIADSVNGVLENDVERKRDAKTAIGINNKSIFYFGSAWADGDALRGIAGDMVFFDEVQDITQTAIESIEKSVSHSEIKDSKTELNGRCFFTGTPKQKGSYYDKVLWGQSDQKKWQVTCLDCGHKQFMTMKNIMIQNEGEENERRYFGCTECSCELDRENGEWIATKPENKMYSGYLFNQLNMSWISANQIWRDYQTMDAMTFHNEVLGEFYSGNEQPLSYEDVLACTDKELSLKTRSLVPTVMGIDYGTGGKSKTIITIGHKALYKGKERLVIDYIENCPIDNHEEKIMHIMNLKERFNCEKINGDIGFGSYESQKLYEAYGMEAIATRYVSYQNAPKKREYKKHVLQVDRTFSMDRLIDAFKRQEIVIPYKEPEKVEYFFDHYTALEAKFTESATSTGRKLYDHSTPDDAFHSLNYVREGIYEITNRFEWSGADRDNWEEDKTIWNDFDSLPDESKW
ncbi:terminase large subunit [Bacillus phage 268TH004]|uniref:Terminase large subunit n=2 Tax=Gettysburgvirus TaxID=3425034 RepID=A0A7T7ZAJ5_9CAUD|nr:terminase large subunit [Bacillus phage 019DV002]QFG05237.1 terminase large subunit [Bacillus phage 019DV004]QQO40356.1 terminase large subunit [Bacillus phage 268TH004]